MSRRALTLPLRLAAPAKPQWVCKRCLATQVEATSSTNTAPPVPSLHDNLLQQNALNASSSQPPQYDPSLPASQRIDPATGRPYSLTKTDFYLKKGLPQNDFPIQYLQHSTSELLDPALKERREKTTPHRQIVGVVVSAGKMAKTVKVRVPGQRWEPRIGKYFASHTNHLVHDPNESLVPGDVVELHRLSVSKAVQHVIASIVAPFGTPVNARPPIPTPDERLAAYKGKRFAKLKRRTLRRQAAMGHADAIQELKAMGLDPGHGVQAGKGEEAGLQPSVGKTRDSGKGAILGEKGQKLPKGVLPGGKHEVGKIDARAKHNKERAMKLERKVKENLLEARKRGEAAEERGVSADLAASTTISRGRAD